MVIAYHLVWTVYGTWLPNDPRGSGSTSVAAPQLAELGELHYGRKKNQPSRQAVQHFYDCAEPRLQFSVIRFNPQRIELVGNLLIIRKHKHFAEEVIDNLQSETAPQIVDALTVEPDHPIWTLGGWKGFLNSPQHVRTVIGYVKRNPIEQRLTPQRWNFVREYDNWPFHKIKPSNR